MFIVDSHCDSIQRVDEGVLPLVNPYNFSKKHKQLQFVAFFAPWTGAELEKGYQRTIRYFEKFNACLLNENIRQVTCYNDIEAAFNEGKHAVMLTMEGGSGINGDIKNLEYFFNRGVRVFGLAWLTNELATSNRLDQFGNDTGLTPLGIEAVKECNRLGMILDVSHLSDRSFYQVLELSKKPIMATHSNFRSLCSHSRNLTDEMAKEIIKQDGMIGLNLYTEFIDDIPNMRTAENLFRHLDHCLELGGENNIGFGCDIDGCDGIYPAPLSESCSMHDCLLEIMQKRNYSSALIKKIAGENHLNFLKKYLD